MSRKEMMAKMFVTVPVKRAILSAAMVNGYLGRAGPGNGGDSDPAAVNRETSRKSSGEHRTGGEGDRTGGEVGSGAETLALDESSARVRGETGAEHDFACQRQPDRTRRLRELDCVEPIRQLGAVSQRGAAPRAVFLGGSDARHGVDR